MKKLYTFSIPDLPPSLDSVYRIGRGQLYKNPDVNVFYKICKYILPKVKDTIDFPVGLSLTFTMANKRTFAMSDTDNRMKVMQDMFQYFGVVKNDNLIRDILPVRVSGNQDCTAGFFFALDDPDYLKILEILKG